MIKPDQKVLITSPHTPDEKGGLATFYVNIASVLNKIGINFETLFYKNIPDLFHQRKKFDHFDIIINIHFLPNLFIPKKKRVLSFIHGSEILMTSPNITKAFLKSFFKKFILKTLKNNQKIIYISQFTQGKTYQKGLRPNYSRDIVLHNGIDTSQANYHQKDINLEEIIFCTVARDVPHKNIKGSIKFCELFQELTGKKTSLYLPRTIKEHSSKITINYFGVSDEERSDVYKRSHYNLIFSLDHSKKGFFEGFGLVVLEAACFGTPSVGLSFAGLTESIHHKKTGYLLDQIKRDQVLSFINYFDPKTYQRISNDCYEHTLESHSLKIYERFFKELRF